jgi:Family of unknown function (DUF5329)
VRARSTGCLFLVLGLLLPSVVCAEPPINVQVEVEFLLGYVEGSECEFYRNGTWHDPKAAQAHLRDKYRYLAARNLINTTEDFIEKVATQSSLSGQPYKVRCRSGATVTANQWLRAELARFREFNKRPTSSLSDQGRKGEVIRAAEVRVSVAGVRRGSHWRLCGIRSFATAQNREQLPAHTDLAKVNWQRESADRLAVSNVVSY